MVRKHARRAVKAAFAVALAIPIVLGGTANAKTRSRRRRSRSARRTSPRPYVLGQLYKQALEAKGFKVAYKENIGSSELIDTALTSGKINFYPEYTGVIALNLAHAKKRRRPRPRTTRRRRRSRRSAGYTLLKQTPFFDADSFAVLKKTAAKYGLKTISDLKKVPNLSYARLSRVRQAHHLPARAEADLRAEEDQVRPARDDPGHEADRLRQGHRRRHLHDRAGVRDRQVRRRSIDDKHIFGFQNVAPVVSKKLVAAYGAKFTNAVNALSAKLTNAAMIAMNKAVGVDKKTPAAVAKAFLKANGLA